MSLIFNSGTQLKTYDSKNNSKKCTDPMCGKIHNIGEFYCSCFGKDTFRNKNKGDLAISGFLPHLPYSWNRSVTNLDMLMNILREIKISENLYKNKPKELKNNVLRSFLDKGLITIDSTKRNDIKYIKGGPERRISEYFLSLQVLNLIDENYSLTPLGNFLVNTNNTMVLFISFYFLRIKNKFLKDKVYENFNVYHFKNLFEILEKEQELSLEELIFLLMAHTNDDYLNVHNPFFRDLSGVTNSNLRKSLIQRYFLGDKNKEMGRQKGAIFNILVSANILVFNNKNKLYSLTTESMNVLKFLKENQQQVDLLMETINSEKDATKDVDNFLNLCKNIIDTNKPTINNIIHKSGGKHEKNMLKMFDKTSINFRKYDKKFSHIKLPANVLISLSGGTEHNPDHLCNIKDNIILVDSKSSQSIHGEVHKVTAYNIYAKEVNSKTFIFLDDYIPNKTIKKFKGLIEENPENIDRIALFTKKAIEELCSQGTVKINFEKIYQSNQFLLVCSKNENNFSTIEKELKDNIYSI